jgi:hypothetical protein
MKIRNTIYVLLAVMTISITSCKDQFELDLLNNPNAVTQENADLELFWNAIQLNFRDFLENMDGRAMPATRLTAMGNFNYQTAFTANGGNNLWSGAYSNLFPDMDAMIELAASSNQFIHVGGAKVMKAWVLFGLVDMFGDVPYTEAGQGVAVPSPNSDDQQAVYTAALALLDEAIADLNNPDAIGAPGSDLFFGGETTTATARTNWIKLANTLKIRYHLTTRLVGGSAAAINAIVASGDFISASGEDFAFQYGTNLNNPNSKIPFFNEHYLNPTGGGRYLSNDFMYKFLRDNDPRRRYYFYRQHLEPGNRARVDAFTLGCRDEPRPDHYTADMPFCVASVGDAADSEGYWGRDHGNGDGTPPDGDKRTNWGAYPAAGCFDSDQGVPQKRPDGTLCGRGAGITPHMMHFHVDFMRAEASLTMGTTDDARALFEAGMRNSINYTISFANSVGQSGGALEPSAGAIDAYVNDRLAEYDAANADGKLNLVISEWHRSSWGVGMEMYNAYRRTGYPNDLQFTENLDGGDFPRLMFYPGNYVDLNANAVQRNPTEQVFWDTNPGGFIN